MLSAPDPQPATRGAGRLWGASVIALCVVLIIYASLYPFSGWQIPVGASWQSLWSRYYAEFDIFVNFFTYVPLGFLAAAAWSRRSPKARAFVFAVLCGAMLSLVLEVLQLFLPTRVTSLLDWLANSVGAASGALLCLSAAGVKLRYSMQNWRARVFFADTTVDVGLVLILIWLLGQINPSVPFFEAGNMINRLTASWKVNPYDPLFLIPQIVGIGLNACGFALFVSVLLKTRVHAMLMVVVVLALGLSLKLVAAGLMLKAPLLENWLGPASVLGVGAGLGAALPLLAFTHRARVLMALLLVFAGGLMSKMASIYDAFSETLQLFSWPYGQLSNFASLTHYLHEIWPLLALAFLAFYFIKKPAEDLQ